MRNLNPMEKRMISAVYNEMRYVSFHSDKRIAFWLGQASEQIAQFWRQREISTEVAKRLQEVIKKQVFEKRPLCCLNWVEWRMQRPCDCRYDEVCEWCETPVVEVS